MFYNVENLFDTIDDPMTLDDSYRPGGRLNWNSERYLNKLDHVAQVLGDFGMNGNGNGADIIGLCEIENNLVLRDLTNHVKLRAQNYDVIHIDSPDRRGIDVGFIYRASCFLPIDFRNHPLVIFNDQDFREYTRDQLVVFGLLDGEEIFFIINHWPSRRGGEQRSKPYRKAAAQLTRKLIDSIRLLKSDPKIVIMGDFNDNPFNDSFKVSLQSHSRTENTEQQHLYNPMEFLYRRGVGSLAYRDKWELFDQILVTPNLLVNRGNKYFFWKAGVYIPEYIITQDGRFKGYPYRTYAAGVYQGGYSDHFPVYLFLIREIPR